MREYQVEVLSGPLYGEKFRVKAESFLDVKTPEEQPCRWEIEPGGSFLGSIGARPFVRISEVRP